MRMTERTRSRGWLIGGTFAAVIPVLAARLDSPWSVSRTQSRTVWDSVYTISQAAVGEAAYGKTCARCHGASLSGADESPALTGSGFLGNWNGLPLSDLQTRIRTTMPTDSAGIYDRRLVTDVIAYLLKANGFPAGNADLPNDVEQLKEILIQARTP
jgi:mono/diheme cytochrome c family protein